MLDRVAPQFSSLLVAVVLLGVCLVAVSHESFWIDELVTIHFADNASPAKMWQAMIKSTWPEVQAPFYMLYIWAWHQLFGGGEWTLRMAGVPWFILGATFFVTSLGARLRPFALLLITLNPFIWFYLNEARLYTLQVGFTFMVLAAFIQLKRHDQLEDPAQLRWLALLCAGTVLLSAVSALGMVWASAACLAVPAFFPRRAWLGWIRRYWPLIGATALSLALIAGYYLWTRTLNVKPTDVATTNWKTLLFVGYELLGFNGVGPGRTALRETGLAALKPYLPALAAYGAALGLVVVTAVREARDQKLESTALRVVLALAVPSSLILGLALMSNFRVLGRHCSSLTPLVICLLTLGAWRLWQSDRALGRVALVAFLGLSLLSCGAQRFASRHAKDDYRSAANLAKAALQQGQTVWWNADAFGCEYYRVPFDKKTPAPGQAWAFAAPLPGFAEGRDKPDWVLVSKPDVYDRRGGLQDFLAGEKYEPVQRMPAFVVFQRPGS